jgi:hypothetical protein
MSYPYPFSYTSTTTLPSVEKLMNRLRNINTPCDCLETKIYPNLVKALAEQPVNATQLLTIICDCVFDNFGENIPSCWQAVMYRIYQIIKALVPDRIVAHEAINLWDYAMEQASKPRLRRTQIKKTMFHLI